uniref:Sec20 C-terminal domain-containing protein n=1 Tax=Acrobeloides nanus TaxID=290746 RepID=A0A914D072_9BILA
MSEQVQRSEDTTSTLIHSSAVLHETHNQFNAVGATIRVGGKMISKYARRETTDKFLIGLALLPVSKKSTFLTSVMEESTKLDKKLFKKWIYEFQDCYK